jgi:RNA polymerase sigma factor (sigma-70 family)
MGADGRFGAEVCPVSHAIKTSVIRQIDSLFASGSAAGLSDGELIERFVAARDESAEAAFAALVARHGPMVLRVCREFLRDQHHAEDAFQAVFLVLARRARSIRDPDLLSNWLYGVALRTARKAKGRLARRRENDLVALGIEAESTAADAAAIDREHAEVLHDEVGRLPQSFRLPVVFCYLEGLSLAEAAERLDCPAGTVHSRLARAREKLRRGLVRRGIVLSGTALVAAFSARRVSAFGAPLLYRSTTQAAINFVKRSGTGRALPGAAAALADDVVGAMLLDRLKATAVALLLLAALAGGAGSLIRAPARANVEIQKVSGTTPQVPAKRYDAPHSAPGRMFVSGRVLDPVGKPMAGVPVDVIGRPRRTSVATAVEHDSRVLVGSGATGSDGRFHFDALRTQSTRYFDVDAVAAAPGYGLGWARLNPDAPEPSAEITLRLEEAIHAKLIDIKGQPAVGVEVRVAIVGRGTEMGTFEGVSLGDAPPPVGLRAWPSPVKTDDQGRITLAGIGRGLSAAFSVCDPRFAPQGIRIAANDRAGVNESILLLQPSTIIEGRVLAADTGQAIPFASIAVTASLDEAGGLTTTWFRADAEGRYSANPSPGGYFRVNAAPPEGQPYLIREDEFAWTKGAVKRTLDITLPRGVLIRGKVTEERTGRALSGASVQYLPCRKPRNVIDGWQAVVATTDDGTFQIAVPPGKGHLFVYGPTADYILTCIGTNMLYRGQPGGERYYAHRIIPYDAEIGRPFEEIAATLRPGKTVKGRMIGPNGQTVDKAEIIATLHFNYFHLFWRGDLTIHARDGRFELHGLDPEKPTKVSFLDADHEWGATVEISGKQAGDELTIQLQPCGRANARFVDPDGKPVARIFPLFEIVGTPGPHEDSRDPKDRSVLAADAAYMPNVDRKHYWGAPFTDAEGRITLPDLIPGASYRISDGSDRGEKGVLVRKDFTVKPGETVDLGDILIEKPAR